MSYYNQFCERASTTISSVREITINEGRVKVINDRSVIHLNMDDERMDELKKALEEKNIKIKDEAKKVEEDQRDRFAHLQWAVLE
ncbi:hypothetical protein AIOGIFDO_01748 [Candidatus Methanoperedenaceae archaeon GB37]|nr:hypothetical protein AIOGIFDO_01748 [Candidatus Methanoperedenaceae archaeon GB37]